MAGPAAAAASDPGPPTRRRRRSIFVTVGTTQFDRLTATISNPNFLRLISRAEFGGYSNLSVQFGRGDNVPFSNPKSETDGSTSGTGERNKETEYHGVECSAYRFKPSLHADMVDADLILSHAGAGSIMEGMELCNPTSSCAEHDDGREKKLVVVINSALMDDHQTELADALSSRGYLFVVTDPSQLLEESTLMRIEGFKPVPFPGGDGGTDFARLVDDFLGF